MGDSGDIPNSAWRDLFAAAQALNGGSSDAPKEMSASDRKFLEGAMSEMVRKYDPVRQMVKHINDLRELKNPCDEEIEKVEVIIDALENIVCQIDCAVDFCKLGGVKEIERLMAGDCIPIRIEALRLLPTILQNNPSAQDMLLKTDLMTKLFSLLSSETEPSKVKAGALSGISAMVRGYDVAYSEFRRLNGFQIIASAFVAAVVADDDKLLNKAAITLTSIANDLGYEVSLDHGLPSLIIRMYSQLPANSPAHSYLLHYINENMELEKLDDENKALITTAFERDLKAEREAEEPDQIAIREIEEMISKLKLKR